DLANVGKNVTLGVRPEDLELSSDQSGIPVTVDVVEELGADAYIYGSTEQKLLEATGENAGAVPFIARVDGRRPPEKGDKIYLKPKSGHVHVFNAESGLRVGD
ncbi:MAG: TOBE domain-containing protein, partial [Terrabacter sp.]|nr:TOBE domain-containing protein [Terrabacter sp.]